MSSSLSRTTRKAATTVSVNYIIRDVVSAYLIFFESCKPSLRSLALWPAFRLIEPSVSDAETFDSQTGDAASGAGGRCPWAKSRLVQVALHRYRKLHLPCFAGIPIASMLASALLQSTSCFTPALAFHSRNAPDAQQRTYH